MFLWHIASVSIIFVIFDVFGAIFIFQSSKPLLQHSLLVSLVTSTLFFVTLHLRIFKNFSVIRTAQLGLSHGLLSFPIMFQFWTILTGSMFNLASFSNSALFPTKLFLLENLHIYFPCFLEHPSRENSVHLLFTWCLFTWLNLMLGVVLFSVAVPTLWNSLPEHVKS